MNEIGEKIKELRKKKGLSQEELADSAGINLRTIQRIENNESEPRGNTMNLICKVLDIHAEDILDYGKQTDNSFMVFFHLSVLSFLVIPLGNIILPMILWLTQKDKVIGLKESGANLLNFQIIWTVFLFLPVLFFLILGTQILDHLFGYFIGLYLLNIILSVYFAIVSSKGNLKRKYPTIIKLIK
jgi:transcriptional regulator with XRE-family HTH domain